MKITPESAIAALCICLIAQSYLIFSLNSRVVVLENNDTKNASSEEDILAHCKNSQEAEFKILRADISSILEAETTTRRNLEESPFTCSEGWCTASDNYFNFPKGIVIGEKNTRCDYGTAILSVDSGQRYDSTNCPSGNGAVTFGIFSVASGFAATVTGGFDNKAIEIASAVSGGFENEASGRHSTIGGGYMNKATDEDSHVSGGELNIASGKHSSVNGGYQNVASGKYSSVNGGQLNEARGNIVSISGGLNNKAISTHSSVLGGLSNAITDKEYGTIPEYAFDCEDEWCTSHDKYFLFPKGVVIGGYNSKCEYGDAILSVDLGNNGNGRNCPEGDGSVTFGFRNEAIGIRSTILGGQKNKVRGDMSTNVGGYGNKIGLDGDYEAQLGQNNK